MIWLIRLGWRSIQHRAVMTTLTVVSISLAVALFLSVETIRKASRTSFEGTISKTDLIVGARSGATQLLLYSVFHKGEATQSISLNSFEHFAKHAAVDWAVPIALGDSHRGYRVLATTKDFFAHYKYRDAQTIQFAEGRAFSQPLEVVLGSEVAKQLNYKTNDAVVVAHGVVVIDDGSFDHADKPFKVSGILAPTGTPLDQLLFISLESFESIHSGMNFMPKSITAFYLGLKTRRDTILLKREIETFKAEPLTAILPGATLADLWRIVGYVEQSLNVMSLMVVFVGLMGMLIGLYTTLSERRREMAILRAIGMSPRHLIFLFVSESFVLTLLGCLGGLFLQWALLLALKPWMTQVLGMEVSFDLLANVDWFWYVGILGLGTAMGLFPAIRAYRLSLHDGLSVRL